MCVNYIPIITCVTLRQATSAILVCSPPWLSASSSHSKCPCRAKLGLPAPKAPNYRLQPPPVPLPSNEGCRLLFRYQPPNAARHVTARRFQMQGLLRLWGRHFDGVDNSIMGGMFQMRADVSTMGWTIWLRGGRFDYRADDLTVGQTIRLWVCALTLVWTFRLWGGHFDCRMDVSTTGCVYGHWGGHFDCRVCISVGHRHMPLGIGMALFCSAHCSTM